MSVCAPCLKVCNVPLCTTEIILGSISSLSADVKIIIENNSTGRKQYVSTQSDGAGVVTLVTAGLGFMADKSYTFSVILATATALCDTETLTVDTTPASCVTVLFENIIDTGGCQITFASQTLTPVPDSPEPSSEDDCHFHCLLGKAIDVDFSTANSFTLPYENGRSLQNIIPFYARIEYSAGDFADGNAQLEIKDTVNTYFNDLTGFDNTFIAGVRKVIYTTLNPYNVIKSGALTVDVITPSSNPGTKASIYIYGLKI